MLRQVLNRKKWSASLWKLGNVPSGALSQCLTKTWEIGHFQKTKDPHNIVEIGRFERRTWFGSHQWCHRSLSQTVVKEAWKDPGVEHISSESKLQSQTVVKKDVPGTWHPSPPETRSDTENQTRHLLLQYLQ